MPVVDPHVVGEHDSLVLDDIGIGGQKARPRPCVPLAFLNGVSTDPELVRFLARIELGTTAEPLVACGVVRQRVPDRFELDGVGALQDEGGVCLAALDGATHGVDSLSRDE